GEATPASDVDLLVRFREGASIFDQVGLWQDLQALLGYEVDLLAEHPEAGRITQLACREGVPLWVHEPA
ncbi:MAG: nucleotidyltransferase, partial [Anaerolineae bacterium]|nr:nucleotidyltransferase [Anaerolineae bacterium]